MSEYFADTITSDFRDQGFDKEALDPANSKPGPALRAPPDPDTQDSRYTAPSSAKVGNISLFPCYLSLSLSHSLSLSLSL